MIRAVGFDLDGTLFDLCGAATAGLETLLQERGWVYESSACLGEEWIRIDREYFADFVAGNLTVSEQHRLRMRDFLAAGKVAVRYAELDELVERYLFHYAKSWIAYPDVRPALERLRNSGFRLAVLTNGQQEQQEAKLVRMGIRDMFESVLAFGTLSALKPEAMAFMDLSSVFGCDPHEIAYVGDDAHADAIAATNAGLYGVWLNREGQKKPEDVEVEITSLTLFNPSTQ